MSRKKENKNNAEKTIKLGWVMPLSILFLSVILSGGFLPVFYDFSKLTCILKVAFIVCYILGLALVIALAYFDRNNKKQEESSWKDTG